MHLFSVELSPLVTYIFRWRNENAWIFSTLFGFKYQYYVWWFPYLSSKGISSWQLKAVIKFWTKTLLYFNIKKINHCYSNVNMYINVNIRLKINEVWSQVAHEMCLIKLQLDWWIDWNNVIHSWIHLKVLVYWKSPKHEERVDLDCIKSVILSNIYKQLANTVFHWK